MGSVPFHYVDLRAFSYATEDEQRVKRSLRTLLPEEQDLERTTSKGHHGDRIVVLSSRVEHADGLRHVLDRLGTAPGFETLLDELDDRVTEHCELFVRLDKQAALDGRVRLGDGITLRAKVEAYPAKRSKAVTNARDALAPRAG